MYLEPLPGVDREQVRETATTLAGTAGDGTGVLVNRLEQYLKWINDAQTKLVRLISPSDLEALLLTDRYARLLAFVGAPAVAQSQQVVGQLLRLEIDAARRRLDAVTESLREERDHWSGADVLVVPDTSYFIEGEHRLEDLQPAHLIVELDQRPNASFRLVVPLVVVDELDKGKRNPDRRKAYRAAHALAVISRHLGPRGHMTQGQRAALLASDENEGQARFRRELQIEVSMKHPVTNGSAATMTRSSTWADGFI